MLNAECGSKGARRGAEGMGVSSFKFSVKTRQKAGRLASGLVENERLFSTGAGDQGMGLKKSSLIYLNLP